MSLPENSGETADSVEKYLHTDPSLRDQLFGSAVSPQAESPLPAAEFVNAPKYPLRYSHEYYGKAYKDPYAYQTIFFQVAEKLGYKISYSETVPDAGGEHRWTEAVAVMVDSGATQWALRGLQFAVARYDVAEIVRRVSQPAPSALEPIALGDNKSLEHNSTFNHRILPAGHSSIEQLAQRSFLVAHEREVERATLAERHGFPRREADSRDFRFKALSERFISQGVTPITPDDLGGLLMQAAHYALRLEPLYRPPTHGGEGPPSWFHPRRS